MEKLLLKEGITEYGIVDFNKLKVINPRILPEGQIGSALMILMPYRHEGVHLTDGLNVGLFARCKDYHAYFLSLKEKLLPVFEAKSGGKVYGFADHSPIHEKDAAAKCGLGFIGKNGLLINKRYGSYVFIGTFLFEKTLKEKIISTENSCIGCDACLSACPTGAICKNGVNAAVCLSCISQKSKKTVEELVVLHKNRTLWGCDICQTVCPHNANAAYSTIPYFAEELITAFTEELLCEMSEEIYKKYAFSYRKRKVIIQNFLTAMGKYDIIT